MKYVARFSLIAGVIGGILMALFPFGVYSGLIALSMIIAVVIAAKYRSEPPVSFSPWAWVGVVFSIWMFTSALSVGVELLIIFGTHRFLQ